MELIILLTTPKGEAKAIQGKFRPFILGFKTPTKMQINKDDSMVLWTIDVNSRQYKKIEENANKFYMTLYKTSQSRLIKGMAKLGKVDNKEFFNMINNTFIEVIKESEKEKIKKLFI